MAQKLCDSAMELQSIQEKLAVAVPQFTPEPMDVVSQADGCSVNSGNSNGSVSTGNDKALTAEEAAKAAATRK